MNLMPKTRVAISIRSATKKDLAAVEKWLRAEHEQTGGGFFCAPIIHGTRIVLDATGRPITVS
jgi:hypothetical protein